MQFELEVLPWSCALCDQNGTLLEFNALWRRRFGLQTDLETCVPGARLALQKARAARVGEVAVFQCALPLSATETLIARFSALPDAETERWLVALHPDAQTPALPAETARDWGDLARSLARREAEREQDGVALRLQARHWKAFFRDAAAGKALIGLRGETLEVNAALCALVGRDEATLLDLYARDLRHPDDRARIDEHYAAILAGGPPVTGAECRYLHRDGHYLSCLLALSLVRDSRERPLYFAAEIEDITERRAAQTQLLERTRELERSNAELERFAFVASHDLQEPLRKIRVFGDRLDQSLAALAPELMPDGARFLDGITRAAARMQNLIDDLLEYARLQDQSAPLRAVDLNDLWRELEMDFADELRESGGQLEVANLPLVLGHAGRLRQLFANLLSNALKFRGETAPLIRVLARRERK